MFAKIGGSEMKNYLSAIALLSLSALAGTGSAVAAEEGVAKCSVATLHGTYLFAYEGFTIEGDRRTPFALAGYEVYNGEGSVRGVSSTSENGEVTRNESFSGRHTVNADCTGQATYSDATRS